MGSTAVDLETRHKAVVVISPAYYNLYCLVDGLESARFGKCYSSIAFV